MWIFLIFIVFLGSGYTFINLTLFESKKNILVFSCIISAVIFCLFPISIKINMQDIIHKIQEINLLTSLCTYQIFESLITMVISILLIRNHYINEHHGSLRFLSLFPSLIFLVGLFFLQIFMFNKIQKINFFFISLFFSSLVFISLWLIPIIIKKIISEWELRMELKIIISFFQIILSMFLPLLVREIKISKVQFDINILTTLIVITIMSFVFLTGFLIKFLKKE